jgi:hypothetical protein
MEIREAIARFENNSDMNREVFCLYKAEETLRRLENEGFRALFLFPATLVVEGERFSFEEARSLLE